MTPVTVERTVPVPPERAFDAWLREDDLRVWMAPLGDVELDPRVGGRFRIVMHRDDREGGPIEHVGEYRELDRPRRLVFTWISPYTDGESLVTVELSPLGEGTRIVLTHEGLPDAALDGHAGGWETFLDRLGAVPAMTEDGS